MKLVEFEGHSDDVVSWRVAGKKWKCTRTANGTRRWRGRRVRLWRRRWGLRWDTT